jgi:deazaflavin-dependent oxidoreductase (nitroreductase family)
LLTGLPVIFLTIKGKKSGQPRVTPLLAISDGSGYILIATKFGADHHPQWYFNIKANPEVEVRFGGKVMTYRAEELDGERRQIAWECAVGQYAGYSSYERRAAGRRIPVLKLIPIKN